MLESDLFVGYRLTYESLLQVHLTLDNPSKYWPPVLSDDADPVELC